MHYYILTIVTENQKQQSKAEKLADLIKSLLPVEHFEITSYPKFKHSFKLVFRITSKDKNDIVLSVEMTDRICTPWLIRYDRELDEAELIFNKNDHSVFRQQNFNVIQWAHFEKSFCSH